MKNMNEYFNNKKIIITGGAGGIGLAMAEQLLASENSKVVIADISEENLLKAERALEIKYGTYRIKGLVCDVTDQEAVKKMIADAQIFLNGKIDLLFNNAGTLYSEWFEDISIEEWHKAFELNYYSAIYSMLEVLPIMKAQGGGQIINIISGSVFMPFAQWTPYVATKSALNGLTLALRSEYWDDNIKISSATPGTTSTGIWDDERFSAPDNIQTPEVSAARLLAGVVNNDRIIFGDDPDAKGATDAFHKRHQKRKDDYLLRVARERRAGKSAI